nr:ABC transporter permease [Actinomadura rubrisoli]
MPRGRALRFAGRRLLTAVPVLWAAVTLSFAMLHLVPGDPVKIMLDGAGSAAPATPAQERALRHELGLDQPLAAQYARYLGHAARGDFGRSYESGRPVTQALGRVLPGSLALMGCALALALLLGTGLAIAGTATGSRVLGGLLSTTQIVGAALPSYWVGLMLMELFSFRFPLLPATGDQGLESLVLPAVTLALPTAGFIAQILGGSLRQTLAQPFITTARAKGAGRLRTLTRHALRNAAIPALTVAGTTIGGLLGGAVVVETVFARPGLGRTVVDAVNAHDYPVVQGFVCLTTAGYIAISLALDLLYSLLDPRVAP